MPFDYRCVFCSTVQLIGNSDHWCFSLLVASTILMLGLKILFNAIQGMLALAVNQIAPIHTESTCQHIGDIKTYCVAPKEVLLVDAANGLCPLASRQQFVTVSEGAKYGKLFVRSDGSFCYIAGGEPQGDSFKYKVNTKQAQVQADEKIQSVERDCRIHVRDEKKTTTLVDFEIKSFVCKVWCASAILPSFRPSDK
jgi:hypothetical protein